MTVGPDKDALVASLIFTLIVCITVLCIR